MTLTVASPCFIGQPCGHHGQYTFYKGFKYQKRNGKVKTLMLGQFFFVRISAHDDPCIGELQLLWEDRSNDQLLSSTRLYFLPEQTPDGRQPNHGEHEVLAASDKVILRLSDLVSWITDQVDWMTGLRTPPINIASSPPSSVIGCNYSIGSDANGNNTNNNHTVSQYNGKYHRLHSLHPISINSGLDFSDVIHEKQLIGDFSISSSVVVLSYPRYCRYRALLRRIEGKECEWIAKESVQLTINSLGIPTIGITMSILFCRDTFEHEALLQHDLNCDHLAPKLKGRPRKKAIGRSGGCQRSSSPESNTSDESKTSQIRTTRRSALNRQTNNNETKVTKSGTAVPKVNSTNSTINSGNPRFKEMCIKNEQTFLKNLYQFMRERKSPIQRVPHLGFKQIDLYFFYTHAQTLGGYNAITSNKMWKKLYDEMGGDPGSTSAATCTRRHYEKLLLPFERHLNGEQDRRRRRKASIDNNTTSQTVAPIGNGPAVGSGGKRGRKPQKSTENGVKMKTKKTVNGVKGKKNETIEDENDNHTDDSKVIDDQNVPEVEDEENIEESKPDVDDYNQHKEQLKHPKLIVKLSLSKVKSERIEEIIEQKENIENTNIENKMDDVETEEEIEEHDNVDKGKDNHEEAQQPNVEIICEPQDAETNIKEVKEDIQSVVETANDVTESINSDTIEKVIPAIGENVIQLSPVSDISCDEGTDDAQCDNETISSNISSSNVFTNLNTSPQIMTPLMIPPLTKSNGPQIPNTSPLPFPVAASPLFSISSLVNSVRAEHNTKPPLNAPNVSKHHPTVSSSFGSVGSSQINSYQRRPSVIHRATNDHPQLKSSSTIAHQTKKSDYINNYNNKYNSMSAVPIPAHRSSINKNESDAKRKNSDSFNSDVLDLSVKKRCLEADSRTSPSQISSDSSTLLDLSVKKLQLKESVSVMPVNNKVPKLMPVSMTSNNYNNSKHVNLHHHHHHHHHQKPIGSGSGQKIATVNSHPQSFSPKHNQYQNVSQTVHYNREIPKEHVKMLQMPTSEGHVQQRQQQIQQKIIKPQAHHASQPPNMISQEPLKTHLQQQQTSPNIPPQPPYVISSMAPAISEYNPSLPAFYSSPSLWWQNAPLAAPHNPYSASPYIGSTPSMSIPMSQLSPHLIGSQSLLGSASSVQYPVSGNQFSSIDPMKANFATYKHLMDHGFLFPQPFNNYFATK